MAVALPGAVMPDGKTLGEAKLRGVKSSGMILAEDEVGIGEDHAGIMVLDGEAAPGAPLADVLPISDEVMEIEINPNRPDALAVYGVARDLHALTGSALAEDPTEADVEPSGDVAAEELAAVEIADPEICLRFTARVFEDVKIGPSPLWLKQRLLAAGQRPISNVVDITNYVMLAYGQPLHAFDLDKVRGGRIVVRRAEEGETMATLDDVERRFDPDMALVCDAEGPSGIAGIMGGQISEVSEETTRVLMEAATWVGPNILRSSKKLGLRTEASARFEKQLHPELAMRAQRLAARLMVELAGARLAPGTIDAYPRPAEERVVGLRRARIERLLGKEIDADEVERTLGRLGFGLEPEEGDAWRVTVPFWRDSDVQREADLIEEVARIHGLDRFPATLPARRKAVGRLTEHQRLRRRLEDALRDRGLNETVSWSFTAPGDDRAAAPRSRRGAADREPAERGPERDAPAAAARVARRRAAQRQPRPAGRRAVRVRSRLPRRGAGRRGRRPLHGLAAGRRARRGAPPPGRPAHRGAAARLALGARAGGLLRGARRARAAAGGRGRGVVGRARPAALPASRPLGHGTWRRGASSAGSASCTRSSRARGSSPTRSRRSSSTWTRWPS